jgi:hypothetical protein
MIRSGSLEVFKKKYIKKGLIKIRLRYWQSWSAILMGLQDSLRDDER